jgi:hypothetical protein
MIELSEVDEKVKTQLPEMNNYIFWKKKIKKIRYDEFDKFKILHFFSI